MGVEDVIDSWIATGGDGQYPSLQVTRRGPGTLTLGKLTRATPTYFYIAASLRPDGGAVLQDESEGRYTTEKRKLYTKTAEVWPAVGDSPASDAHEADVVTLYPIAALLDVADWCADCDGVFKSTVVGKDGNQVTLELVADGSGAGTLDESGWPALVFHFEDDVTTELDLELAAAAGVKLAVEAAGTPTATFKTADAIGPVAFAGGDGEEWRVVGCSRYRRFWKASIERLVRP